MRYVQLGSSKLKVSSICLGCMGFGNAATGQHSWTIDEEHSRTVIKAALDGGINFFDTAIAYQKGTSEQYVGRALRDFARRDEVVLATKFLPRSDEEIAAGVSGREHVVKSAEQSLTHLGMDHIDLFIYHMWDYRTDLLDIMQGLHELVCAGKVRYLGISNCFAYQLERANSLAREHGLTPFVSVQGHYNLIYREDEREMLQLCAEENIAYTPYSPLAGGRLSRTVEAPAQTRRFAEDSYARFKYDKSAQADRAVIERLEKLSKKRGQSMTALALAWLQSKSCIPVAGVTKLTQLEALLRSTELTLTAEECAYLEEPYQPHALSGVMAQNRPDKLNVPKVWHQANL